ncbi:arylsulfatase [Astrocystis sublimbata]|nr:arylsulfatase [Astrocystis sublimbata]
MVSKTFWSCLLSHWILGLLAATAPKKPNIIFLMSDDQDVRLGSMEYMPVLQREMLGKGSEFVNHHTTTAQCCPSRVTLLRGQQAHNTNVTNVFSPGGNYEKFTLSGQADDYLPHWLKKAGYKTEYLGKFLNGVNILNWASPPRGWDNIEYFVEPYQTTPNRVVMSENGNTPVAYLGYHQTDVMRAKALSRLEYLASQEDPFFFFISPTAPHVDDETMTTVPCTRHENLYLDATAPRTPSYNPPDEIQKNKLSWIGQRERMNDSNVTWTDLEFKRRAQSLKGVDEILEDILSFLEEKDLMDNTYIVYTSDNGYHLGQHRLAAGKTTPFAEDTNLPFSHLDLAPTFLEIAGLAKDGYPSFLDGRSLLDQWKNPEKPSSGDGEVLNVEYWGLGAISIPSPEKGFIKNNTYKSVRIIGEESAYLYIVWCGINQTELYDTNADRLLLGSWKVVSSEAPGNEIKNLKQAMQSQYDEFFDSFPRVRIAECLGYQLVSNEMPFYPPEAQSLATAYRKDTSSIGPSYKFKVMLGNEEPQGGPEQRHATLEDILKTSRRLTKEELDPLQERDTRSSA